jgi:hypothetical protein
VSFKKTPRPGQTQVFNALTANRDSLVVKLPTGYGKTFTCCGVYSLLKQQGRVNRLLVIFPRDAQLDQFLADAPNDDLKNAGVDGPLQIVDLRIVGMGAWRDHRNNNRQIFVITIQSLIQKFYHSLVIELLSTGRWMICVDEHHHYGEEKTWGKTVLSLQRAFLLVMSATPYRIHGDGAFGGIDVNIDYESAVGQNAVKSLRGHAYHYELEVEENGVLRTLTTADLVREAGSDNPDKIEKLRIDRQMRWAPKFISPLITNPIDRMLSERPVCGHPLQTLITALCVSHAEYVCGQIREMYPELRVDWVGTGDFGRDPEVNRKIVKRFCPPKDENGSRPPPALDVLVHVGIAGEGLDAILVSEIVHLGPAGLNNRTNQINGRAARYVSGVLGHINFDASSDLAAKGYLGENIMKAMDLLLPTHKEPKPSDDDELPPDLPDEPTITVEEINFIGIDSGDAGVQAFARFMQRDQPQRYNLDEMNSDPQHAMWQEIIDGYRNMRRFEADQQNDKSILAQWSSAVNAANTVVRRIAVHLRRREGLLVDGTVVARISHVINARKRGALGEFNKENRHIDVAKAHWQWLKQTEREFKEHGLPEWLRF